MGTGRLYDVWGISGSNLLKIVNNTISKTINGTGYFQDICIDKNNIVWVSDSKLNTVSKIVDDVIVKTITVGYNPYGICVDKNNAIWVANSANATVNGTYTISKIVNDVVVKTITVNAYPIDICCDKNNTIWVVHSGSGTITKIVNDIVEKTISVGTDLRRICVDKNNAIWVANYSSINNVYKIVNDVVTKTIKAGNACIDICCDKNNAIYLISGGPNDDIISKIVNDVVIDTIYIDTENTYGVLGICIDNDNSVFISKTAAYGMLKISNSVSNNLNINTYLSKITTGMEYELLFGKKNLIQSGNIINTFNGTDFSNVGTSPVTDSMLETYGFSDFAGLTKAKLNTLSNPKLLVKKTDNNTTNTKYTGTPLPKLVLAKNDITLSASTSKVDSFTLTATEASAGSNIKIIYSVDQGTTWNTYKSGVQSIVNINDLSTIKANGNTLAEFNAITDWNTIITNKKIRFAYYLEVNSITDTVYTDLLTMQVDMNGIWKLIDTPDYQYYYGKDNELTINLLADGDYRLNV